MKHPVYERHHGYGAEWLQALFTLVVLVSLYQYSLTFNSNTNLDSGGESKQQTSSYWNESLGYGFRGNEGDTYNTSTGKAIDTVSVSSSKDSITADKNVRVSFYTASTIADIEKNYENIVNKTFSRLPNGIAVIEGDISSLRAKNVLATLHAR